MTYVFDISEPNIIKNYTVTIGFSSLEVTSILKNNFAVTIRKNTQCHRNNNKMNGICVIEYLLMFCYKGRS